MELRNERLSDEEFFRERKEVLAMWPTGKDVDLDEAVEFQKSLPANKVYLNKLAAAKRNGDTLIHVWNGTPTLEEEIELGRLVVEEGGADVIHTHQDAFTRNTMFDRAEQAVKESIRLGKPLLNGFPIVIHGVAANRKLIEAYPVASLISGCSCDGRLIAEIGLAGGHTAMNFGPLFPFFTYNRDTSLETSIRNSQYRCRLMGYYEERGAPILYAPEGGVSGGVIIEALLGAEQGVKHLRIGSNGGSLAECFARGMVQPKLAREYLDRFGHKDVEIIPGPGGGPRLGRRYPLDHARAFAVLAAGVLGAVLCGSPDVAVYTVDEGHEIPTHEGKVASIRHAKMVAKLWKGQGQNLGLEDSEEVKTEARMYELEIRAILDRVIELGDGDVAVGAIRAFEAGVLDEQFSTARGAARKCMMVRDAQTCWRYLDHGNLPLPKEVVEYHKEKIAERAEKEGREIGYEAIIEDVLAVDGEEVVAVR